ncbi:AraC family transcriptional regulator [Emticicia aquatilis]|uniref:AraC family transcriptional regulator n=2 Tax=Emticicia aquatilis TaxID=1537369 RepID=A0A916YL94_9BACT|nr:AraC family transcriptional regulator [Emticicia aquatilis]
MVVDHYKKGFISQPHFHEDFELNFIENAKGAKRIVGDSNEQIDDLELVLVGPNLPHNWAGYESPENEVREITVQFHRDLFNDKLLQRNQLSAIRTMLEKANMGIAFSQETITQIKPRLTELSNKNGFNSVIELISILNDLSVSPNMRTLTSNTFSIGIKEFKSRRLEKAFEYMKANYNKEITLEDIAKIVNMAEVSFSRFIKKCTGKTFVDSLNDIRLGHATRLLIETTFTISEISSKCGYNNLSYFNRVFKKKHEITPKEFRENYAGTKTFV